MSTPRRVTRWNLKRFHASTVITLATYALVGLMVIVGLVALVSSLVAERSRADENAAVISSLRERISAKDDDLGALLDRYAELYDDCDAAAECVSTAPAPEVVERVLPVQGPTGAAGRAPTDDEIDDAVIRYCLLTAQCRGEVGAAGTGGTNGADGAPGADGSDGVSIVGPQGEPGIPGAPGSAGEPPVSWTYTDAIGIERSCTRVEDFDASAPRYACS